MPIPVIEGYEFTTYAAGSPQTEIVLTKPAGVQVGDFLCLLVTSDDNTDGDSFQAVTGWTKSWEQGSSSVDVHSAMYWRIADGTEASTVTVGMDNEDDVIGWYIRISGVDNASPINAGPANGESVETSPVLSAVTTGADDCLAMSFLGHDGGDGVFSIIAGGPAWAIEDQGATSGGDSTDASGCWSSKDMASLGSTGTHEIDTDHSDGQAWGVWALLGASEVLVSMNAAALTATAENLTLVPGAVTLSMNVASLQAVAENLTVVPGPVTIPMNVAILTLTAETLDLVPGPVTITMNVVDLVSQAQDLTVIPGPVSIVLQNANITVTAETLQPFPRTIIMKEASIQVRAEPLELPGRRRIIIKGINKESGEPIVIDGFFTLPEDL